MMMTCISTQLQIYARKPHVNKFPLSNLKPKFTSIRMLNNNTSFRSCSISYNNNYDLLGDRGSIVKSCSRLYPICNLFDDIRNNYKPMQILSRMLTSSVLLLAVMTMALFCTQVPASAASYGRMGGGSGGSSESSSSSSSSRNYYIYDDDDCSSCNCKTRIKKNRRRSCTICNCYKEKNEGKRKSCTGCNCYKEKECSSSSSNTAASRELLTSSCNCNCHIPCECSCHVPVAILDKKRVLQMKLNRIAGTADTITKSGLNCVLKEVVKSLFELHDHCHFAYLYAKYDHLEKYSRPCFRGFLETWVRKFDRNDETFVNVDGVKYRKESVGKVNSIDNEYSVVTLLVLVDGEYLIPSLKGYTTHVKKVDVKTALQTIHSIPMRNLEAVEVLWTPQTENDVVSEQEVRRDFGLLMRPVV